MKLTVKRLKEVLHYNPNTGIFTRRRSYTRSDLIGKRAGGIQVTGYIGIHIDGTLYLAHRLAFLYMIGRWPKNHTDHINTIRSDNRWINLREATRTQNNQNGNKKRGNLPKGVEKSTTKRNKPFLARISANGKRHYLGYFSTPEKAHLVYCETAKKLHKEFARFT